MRCLPPSAGLAAALALVLPSVVDAGSLSLPLQRNSHREARARRSLSSPPSPEALSLRRRDGSLSLEAINSITFAGHCSTLGIGTPPQNITFQLDTGSSDTWVTSATAPICSDESLQQDWRPCGLVFNDNLSRTFDIVDRNGFEIAYLDGGVVTGHYFDDTVTIGDVAINNQRLGLALDTERNIGIMGLGYNRTVASGEPYPVLVDNMVSQGIINSPVFSLYLNDLDASSGTILFGGIDSRKYAGDLAVLPLIPDATLTDSPDITSYTVSMDGFRLVAADGSSITPSAAEGVASFRGDVVLDSGSTVTILPADQAAAIEKLLGVFAPPYGIATFVDCAWAGERGRGIRLELQFAGKTIFVPVEELVLPSVTQQIVDDLLSDPRNGALEDFDAGVCLFGAVSADHFAVPNDNWALLGDTVLRSAYVVYDMANREIGIAQANLNRTESDIVEFESAGQRIDDLVNVVDQSDDEAATLARLPSLGLTAAAALLAAVAATL